MLYSAESDLELRIIVQNDECILAGQVIGEGWAVGQVAILAVVGKSEATLNEVSQASTNSGGQLFPHSTNARLSN